MTSASAKNEDIEPQHSASPSEMGDSIIYNQSEDDNLTNTASEAFLLQDNQETSRDSKAGYSLDMLVATSQDTEAVKEFSEILARAARDHEKRNQTSSTESDELQWFDTTATNHFLPQIVTELLEIFAVARYEYFEDGVETDFSRNIVQLVELYRESAVEAFRRMLSQNLLEPRLVAEAFRWFGQMEDSASHVKRRELLEKYLSHHSPYIRDGAMVGLAYMDDPAALDALRNALQHETITELRKYIQETINQLNRTQLEKE